MSDAELTPTQVTMARIREEWEAPLKQRIEELSAENKGLVLRLDECRESCARAIAARDVAVSRLDTFTGLMRDGLALQQDGLLPLYTKWLAWLSCVEQALSGSVVERRVSIDDDAVLCYVSDGRAFFTTQPLDKQWGDDWNDAPYEHNAGSPYAPHRSLARDFNEDGSPKWRVFSAYYAGDFVEPKDGHLNSPYSVEQINRGEAPWLVSEAGIVIQAGTSYRTFVELVEKAGGTVSRPSE